MEAPAPVGPPGEMLDGMALDGAPSDPSADTGGENLSPTLQSQSQSPQPGKTYSKEETIIAETAAGDEQNGAAETSYSTLGITNVLLIIIVVVVLAAAVYAFWFYCKKMYKKLFNRRSVRARFILAHTQRCPISDTNETHTSTAYLKLNL